MLTLFIFPFFFNKNVGEKLVCTKSCWFWINDFQNYIECSAFCSKLSQPDHEGKEPVMFTTKANFPTNETPFVGPAK